MNNPLISVIIPVYKVEEYINECVDSVLNQTYKNLEIILVDDGSPDNCPQICDEYAKKDNRVKVIHKENGGTCAARNTGIKVSTGEYLCFMDDDDWLSPFFVEQLYNACLSKKCLISCCKFKKTKANFIDNYDITRSDSSIIEKSILELPLYIWNKMYDRSVFENVKFDEQITVGEDWFFTIDLYTKKYNYVAFVNDDLYYYRDLNNSQSKKIYSNSRYKVSIDKLDRIISNYFIGDINYNNIVFLNGMFIFKYILSLIKENKKRQQIRHAKSMFMKNIEIYKKIRWSKQMNVATLVVPMPNIIMVMLLKMYINLFFYN